MIVTIDLLRHGSVDGPGALYGRTDVGLSAAGWQAMAAKINAEQSYDKVFSSPRARCRTFAEHMQPEFTIIDGLAEIDFGQWDGLAFDDMSSQQMDKLQAFADAPGKNTPPDGESVDDFYSRVVKSWQQVVEQSIPGRNLVVCHAGTIRMILAYLLSVPADNGRWFAALSVDYAGLTRIEIPDHRNATPIVRFINQEAVL